MITDKPPLGVMPRYLHDRQRALEIILAIKRYLIKERIPHWEWICELEELIVEWRGKV